MLQIKDRSQIAEWVKYNPYHDRLGRFASGGGGRAGGGETPNLDFALTGHVQAALGDQEIMQKAWERNPKEAAKLKQAARKELDKEYPGINNVTIYHVGRGEHLMAGEYGNGLKPFTSCTTSLSSARQVAKDFKIENPVLFTASVPKTSVAIWWKSNPVFNQSGLPASHQKEILLDKPIPFSQLTNIQPGFKEASQKSITDLPDDNKFWQEIRQQVTKEIQPLFLELMLAGVEFATEAVNLARKKISGQKAGPIDTAIYIPDEDILAREIAAWLPTFTNSWYDTIEVTTRSRLRDVLAQAVREGQSIDWVYKSIEPLFGATRALRISQTEMTRIFAKGQDMVYTEAGVDTVEWRTVRDFAVCSDCAPLHGKTFPRNDSAHTPPLHILCRCFRSPHITEEAAAEKFL